MNVTTHERPGVYSVYGASSLVRGSGGRKTVGLAAVNTKAEAGVIQTITSYEEAVSTFGSQADSQDMAELIRVILLNGAAAVVAVPVANAEGYEAAFAALSGMEDLSVVVCDSTDQEVQQKLRDSVTAASAARRACRAGNALTGGLQPGFPIPAVWRMGWPDDLTGTPRSFTAVFAVLPIACLEVSA